MIEFHWGKYFNRGEFECRHTHTCEMDQEFIDQLNILREEFGKPLTINSTPLFDILFPNYFSNY